MIDKWELTLISSQRTIKDIDCAFDVSIFKFWKDVHLWVGRGNPGERLYIIIGNKTRQ